MIQGRWKIKSFLDYIRPQVVEWTEFMSEDIIPFDNFFELFSRKSHLKSEPETLSKPRENIYKILELSTKL